MSSTATRLALLGLLLAGSPAAAAGPGGLARVAGSAPAGPPEAIAANQNRVAAGVLRDGVLAVTLEARTGFWQPQAEDGRGVLVQAFGERGKPLQIPGPLLRVRAGTRLQVTVRNTLDEPLVLHGLESRPAAEGSGVRLVPGETRRFEFEAGEPGTYFYWGSTTGEPLVRRDGVDSQLHGALVVDPASGPVPADRVFVLGLWFQAADSSGPEPHGERELTVINGKAWPSTERLSFTVGDTVRWRWLNPSVSPHPMHLHGFYFQVHARGDWRAEREAPPGQPSLVVTELMQPGGTMDVSWVPERPGNWVFHCHFAFHVSSELYLADSPGEHGGHGGKAGAKPHAMSGMVLGLQVRPRGGAQLASARTREPRRIRLLVQERGNVGPQDPHFGYALWSGGREPSPDSVGIPGPTLVLEKGEPVAVTIVNRLREPTAVHWHGIELESFPDGVPGWSGSPQKLLPPIAPQDSFVAEFVPPRAGTFIYHSHSNELAQILGGLVGPLVVLDRGAQLDTARERIFLLSGAAEQPFGLVNGRFEQEPMELVAGRTYRFRFINIGDWRMLFTLSDQRGFPETRLIAKDGADLPQPVAGPLNLLTGPGETADFEFTPAAGDYRLEFKQYLSGFIIPVRLHARAAGVAGR